HVVVLLLVPLLPPARVIEVLPAPGGVEPDRLDVPVRPRADPHLLPGRRDHQPGNTLAHVRRHRLAVGVEVTEAAASPDAPDARSGQVAAPQPHGWCPLARQFALPTIGTLALPRRVPGKRPMHFHGSGI